MQLKPKSGSGLLFLESTAVGQSTAVTPFRVSKRLMELAEAVACHRDHQRWNLLYAAVWRYTHSERHLLELATDALVHRLLTLEKQVRRDCHKMKAFVRFRRIESPSGETFVAWHQPDYAIVRRVAPFFARRFKGMVWSILTPDQSAHWDGRELSYSAGVARDDAPTDELLEGLWTTYYGATFNPARIKIAAMKREMPVRYWKTMPETKQIEDLLKDAPRRVEQMVARTEGLAHSARDFIPSEARDLPTLTAAARVCRGCDLCERATQTVFGEGPDTADMMLIGEQPGDEEDRQGRPFVGPAGRLLNQILAEAEIPRAKLYTTNAVKHFSYEDRGKQRLHKKPSARQITACHPWVEAELSIVKPQTIVCLGATATQSLLGRHIRLTDVRGKFLEWQHDGRPARVLCTWHPSAILRAPGPTRELRRSELLMDLQTAWASVATKPRALGT